MDKEFKFHYLQPTKLQDMISHKYNLYLNTKQTIS